VGKSALPKYPQPMNSRWQLVFSRSKLLKELYPLLRG
jgi:hypothetical protein